MPSRRHCRFSRRRARMRRRAQTRAESWLRAISVWRCSSPQRGSRSRWGRRRRSPMPPTPCPRMLNRSNKLPKRRKRLQKRPSRQRRKASSAIAAMRLRTACTSAPRPFRASPQHRTRCSARLMRGRSPSPSIARRPITRRASKTRLPSLRRQRSRPSPPCARCSTASRLPRCRAGLCSTREIPSTPSSLCSLRTRRR